jgi:hypothetical protein
LVRLERTTGFYPAPPAKLPRDRDPCHLQMAVMHPALRVLRMRQGTTRLRRGPGDGAASRAEWRLVRALPTAGIRRTKDPAALGRCAARYLLTISRGAPGAERHAARCGFETIASLRRATGGALALTSARNRAVSETVVPHLGYEGSNPFPSAFVAAHPAVVRATGAAVVGRVDVRNVRGGVALADPHAVRRRNVSAPRLSASSVALTITATSSQPSPPKSPVEATRSSASKA